MIDLVNKVLTRANDVTPIKTFEVWWQTPNGLFTDLDEARGWCVAKDMPLEVIRPVPVAIGENAYYEVIG